MWAEQYILFLWYLFILVQNHHTGSLTIESRSLILHSPYYQVPQLFPHLEVYGEFKFV